MSKQYPQSGFQKGNKLGGGARTYILEQEQLEKMRKILNKDLKIIARLQDSKKISPIDEKKLAILQSRVSKYLDKLHASKTEMDISGEITSKVVSVDE